MTEMKRLEPFPRAIFFDVGDTLLRPQRPYRELLAKIGLANSIDLPQEAFANLAAHIETRVVERTRRRLPFTFPAAESQRFWFETYRGFFIDHLTPSEADRLALDFLDLLSSPDGHEVFEDTIATLICLSERGYQLGVISNWESWLPTLLESVGIDAFFEHVVISGVCGLEKPDIHIFDLALAESGFRPDDIVYIGDRPAHDVEPALEVGIRPILLDRNDRYPTDPRYQRITSLTDLLSTLENMSRGDRTLERKVALNVSSR